MSEEFNDLLIETYKKFKDYNNPPVPLKEIIEFLKLEGVLLVEEMKGDINAGE